MNQPDHSAIIAAAAKGALGPLGFKQKGRSRVWLGDRGYWLSVVEFQPSGFSKGSSLNVSAHWLWQPTSVLSFDYQLSDRAHRSIHFQTPEQFEPLAAALAALAAAEAERLDRRLSSLEDVARILDERAGCESTPDWPTLHTAVASGLLGDVASARANLSAFLSGSRGAALAHWGELALRALDQDRFHDFIIDTINGRRAGYGYAEWRGSFE